MRKRIYAAISAAVVCFAVVAKDIFEWHVIEFTHGERGLSLAGLTPELYFIEQEYQGKRFVPDQFVDITDVLGKKCELIRIYKCQYRDGAIEKRKCVIAQVNGMHSMLLADGYAEGFMSFVQRCRDRARLSFRRCRRRRDYVDCVFRAKCRNATWKRTRGCFRYGKEREVVFA